MMNSSLHRAMFYAFLFIELFGAALHGTIELTWYENETTYDVPNWEHLVLQNNHVCV